MITVHLIETKPDGRTVDHAVPAKPGQSLMQAAVKAGVAGIAADCGGLMTCATCHVYLRDDWVAKLPAPHEEEVAFLEFTAAERRPGSRLSCQIALTEAMDGLVADLPAKQY